MIHNFKRVLEMEVHSGNINAIGLLMHTQVHGNVISIILPI